MRLFPVISSLLVLLCVGADAHLAVDNLVSGSLAVAIPMRDHVVLAVDGATTSKGQRGTVDACKIVVTPAFAVAMTGITGSASDPKFDMLKSLQNAAVSAKNVDEAIRQAVRQNEAYLRVLAREMKSIAPAEYRQMLAEANDDGTSILAKGVILSFLKPSLVGGKPWVGTSQAIFETPRRASAGLAPVTIRVADDVHCRPGSCGTPYVGIGHGTVILDAYEKASAAVTRKGGLPLALMLLEAQAKESPKQVGAPFSSAIVDAKGARWLHRAKPCQ